MLKVSIKSSNIPFAKGSLSLINDILSCAFPESFREVVSISSTFGSFASALSKTVIISFATFILFANILFIGFDIFESKLFKIFKLILPIPFDRLKTLFKALIDGCCPDITLFLISFNVDIEESILLLESSRLSITSSNLLFDVSWFNLVKKSTKVSFKDCKLESFSDKLSINLGTSSLPLFTASIKFNVREEAEDERSTIKFKSDLIRGESSSKLSFVSSKNFFKSLDNSFVSFRVFLIVGKSDLISLTVSDNFEVASEAKSTVLFIWSNLF